MKKLALDDPDLEPIFGEVRVEGAVIEDAGRRYGSLLAGWWFDDGMHSYYHAEPPWEELLVSARALGVVGRAWSAWDED